jgi:hypothetical protein
MKNIAMIAGLFSSMDIGRKQFLCCLSASHQLSSRAEGAERQSKNKSRTRRRMVQAMPGRGRQRSAPEMNDRLPRMKRLTPHR